MNPLELKTWMENCSLKKQDDRIDFFTELIGCPNFMHFAEDAFVDDYSPGSIWVNIRSNIGWITIEFFKDGKIGISNVEGGALNFDGHDRFINLSDGIQSLISEIEWALR